MAQEKRRRTRNNSKIDLLPEAVKDAVDALLLDPANTYADIAEWLSEQGYEVSKSAVGRYAIRVNEAAARVSENLLQTRALAKLVAENPDMDYSKANRILMMDGLMRRLSAGEDDFADLPLDKAGRLIASLSRIDVAERKMDRDYKTKAEMAFESLEGELMELVKKDPALAKDMKEILLKVKGKMND